MSSYHKSNVKLYEAMTMELKQRCRTWEILGRHVQDLNIPAEANVTQTFVMKTLERPYQLAVFWEIKEDNMSHCSFIAEFFELEELRKNYPNLFELEGWLIAFA